MKKLNNEKKISEINLSFIKDFVRFHFSLLFWQILSMNIQRLKMFYFKVHQAKLRFLIELYGIYEKCFIELPIEAFKNKVSRVYLQINTLVNTTLKSNLSSIIIWYISKTLEKIKNKSKRNQ